MPGDLRRTPDEEVEAPDVLAVVARRGREDGAPPKREAPEPKDLRARSPVVRPPTAGRADAGDHGPQHLEAIARGHFLVGLPFKAMQKPFRGTEDTCTVKNRFAGKSGGHIFGFLSKPPRSRRLSRSQACVHVRSPDVLCISRNKCKLSKKAGQHATVSAGPAAVPAALVRL